MEFRATNTGAVAVPCGYGAHPYFAFPLATSTLRVPFGRELRRLGCTQRQGFFLHVPFPPFGLFAALPRAEELIAPENWNTL